jgi:uncharacterized membrane protein YidH (DUF202 family)
MLQWITKSRLRTALAILIFIIAFAISIPLILQGFSADLAPSNGQKITILVGIITAFVSAIGTVSTVILAWRADRRSTRESDLKILQMQQQIAELETKLRTLPTEPKMS